MAEEISRKADHLFSCTFCDETYACESDLQMHSSLHKGSNKFICMVCQESFSKLMDLKAHDLIHSLNEANEKLHVESDFFKENFICLVCNGTFFSEKELQAHHEFHHSDVEKESDDNEIKIVEVKSMVATENWLMIPVQKELLNYECIKLNTCEDGYSDAVYNQKSTALKKYECELCGKKFGRRVNLGMHLKTHSRPHVCRVCDKRFAELKKLRKHILAHEKVGNIRLQCELCEEVFFSETALLKHCSSFHDLTKHYVCEVCSKRFNTKSDFARHKLIHEKKQFVCGLCNSRFTLLLYLKRHMIRHLPDKPFVCTICSKRYSRKSFLLSHLSTHDITDDSRQPVVHYMSKKRNIPNEVNLTKSKLFQLLSKID